MANFIYTISEDSDFLMHHGVKGQKWGVENGPPYPLDSDVSTGKRLKTKEERIEAKAQKVKDKATDKNVDALLNTLAIPNYTSEWQKNKNPTALALAMHGSKQAHKSIQNYRNYVIKNYPKKASDFNEYLDAVKKNTDEFVGLIAKFEESSGITNEVKDAYRKYEKQKTTAEVVGDVSGAVAATLGAIGGFQVGGAGGAYIFGVAAGTTVRGITKLAIEDNAEKKLQKYIDSINDNN